MNDLLKAQQRFSRMLSLLLAQAFTLGYEVTMGECWRSPEEAARLASKGIGIRRSLHCDRLAVDLNLFDKNGVWQCGSDAYRSLGEWWEKQGGSWGGRYGDANHFSLPFGGRR